MSQSELTFTPTEPQPKLGFTLTPIRSAKTKPASKEGFRFTPYNSDGVAAVRSVFPSAVITSGHRNNNIGPPNDDHHLSNAAVDIAPIKGMTFDQFVGKLKAAGYPIIQALDEQKHPSKYATGPHWHVTLGERSSRQSEASEDSEGSAVDDDLTFTPTPAHKLGFTPNPQKGFTLTPIGDGPIKAPQKHGRVSGYSDTPKSPNRAQRAENRPPRPSDDPSLLQSAWLGFKNIPESAWNTAKGIGHAIAHPAEAMQGFGETVGGAGLAAMDALSQKLRGRDFATGPQAKADEAKFREAVKPYTSWKGAKKQFARDPVGTALTVLPIAGGAAKLGVRGAEAAGVVGNAGERAALRAERAEQFRQSTQTKNAFRTVLSRHDLDAQRAAHELESHQSVVGNAPIEHQRAIIHAIESASSGGIKALPEKYRAAAQGIRNVALRYRHRIGEVLSTDRKGGPNFIEDYYARQWKQSPSEVRAAISRQGSGRNLKARRIPTYEDGLAAGLTPVHENPLDGMTAYAQNMSRFLATHDLQNRLRAEGLAKWVTKIPDGWRKLEGINTERKATAEHPGMVLAAPKPVANIWSRHVDQGLRATVEDKFGEGAGKAVAGAQKISDVLGSAKLAFSAFHPVLIAGKGVGSDMGNALRHFTRGAPADAMKALAHMPFAPVATAAQGFRMGRRMLSGDEAMTHLDKLYRDAGGRIGPADVYRSTLSPSLLQSARRGTFTRDIRDIAAKMGTGAGLDRIKAALNLGSRVMESWNDLVFKHYVPMMKRGAFERELATSLKAHPEWTEAQQLSEARRVLSSIDGRMGEIARDNLFWSRTAHQLGRMILLSPSWQIGDARVVAQATSELPESLRGLLKGKGISQGPAQAAGLVGSFMLANALGNYIFTGQPPKDMQDLKAFRTGGTNASDGSPERAQAPSIMKDFFGFASHPQQELVNKLHPALKTALEVYDNRDWRNLPIVRPADAQPDETSRVSDALSYTRDTMLPIPIASNPNGRSSHISMLAQLAGLRPMGAEYTNPERYKNTQQWLADKAWREKKRADAKAKAAKGR